MVLICFNFFILVRMTFGIEIQCLVNSKTINRDGFLIKKFDFLNYDIVLKSNGNWNPPANMSILSSRAPHWLKLLK